MNEAVPSRVTHMQQLTTANLLAAIAAYKATVDDFAKTKKRDTLRLIDKAYSKVSAAQWEFEQYHK